MHFCHDTRYHSRLPPTVRSVPSLCLYTQLLPHLHTDAKARRMLLVVVGMYYVALPISLLFHQVRNYLIPTHPLSKSGENGHTHKHIHLLVLGR